MSEKLIPGTTEYKKAFNKENYSKLQVYISKAQKDELDVLIKGRWKSINAFVNEAIQEKMERENGKEVVLWQQKHILKATKGT